MKLQFLQSIDWKCKNGTVIESEMIEREQRPPEGFSHFPSRSKLSTAEVDHLNEAQMVLLSPLRG